MPLPEHLSWSPNDIIRARKAFRQGASPEEVREILGSKLTLPRFRQTAAKLGFKWNTNKVFHLRSGI